MDRPRLSFHGIHTRFGDNAVSSLWCNHIYIFECAWTYPSEVAHRNEVFLIRPGNRLELDLALRVARRGLHLCGSLRSARGRILRSRWRRPAAQPGGGHGQAAQAAAQAAQAAAKAPEGTWKQKPLLGYMMIQFEF